MVVFSSRWIGIVGAVVLLTACSTVDAVLWPSFVGEETSNVVLVDDSIDKPDDTDSVVLYEDETIVVEPVDSDLVLLARDPLVVIRFADDNVAYQDALYQAVNAALERKPDALFDLVAVAPVADSADEMTLNSKAAKRNAEDVLRSMTDMGLPADRMTLSSTTSGDAAVNQVRIYVR